MDQSSPHQNVFAAKRIVKSYDVRLPYTLTQSHYRLINNRASRVLTSDSSENPEKVFVTFTISENIEYMNYIYHNHH